jgi:hypothetical protein
MRPDITPGWAWSHEADGPLGAPPDQPGWYGGYRLAGWGWRVLAGFIDYGLTFAIPYGLLAPFNADIALVWALMLSCCHSGAMAAYTTQSLGKRLLGIRMVQVRKGFDGQLYLTKVPVIVGVLRVLLHAFDIGCCIGPGLFLPIANKSKGFVADYCCRTLHFRDSRLPDLEQVDGPTEWPG